MSCTQRQVIHLAQQQAALDGYVRIGATLTMTSGRVLAESFIKGARINPERETSTPDESFVIVRPFTDAALTLRILSRIKLIRRNASATIYATTPGDA